MKKKAFGKFILFTAAFLCGLALLVLAGFGILSGLPTVYGESFYAGLKTKYDRLLSAENPKIVVIGGSSAAFGIDSKLVERETGMPCVNFGLYAALGFKPMLDLSRNAVGPGDIVVLAPEPSQQMYSDYIGYADLMKALEGRPDMALALGSSYAKGFLRALPDYLSKRRKLLKTGILAEGVYANRSFDAYGDIIYSRSENVMADGYSKTDLPDLSPGILTDSFFDMVNSFAAHCRARGARVYFGFPPMNALSVRLQNGGEEEFLEKLDKGLEFDVLASLHDHILDPGYFYDSNFHANDPGTIANTILFIHDIQRVTGRMKPLSVEVPEPAAREESHETGDILNDGIFCYTLTEKGILLKGLTEEGKKLEILSVPTVLDGYRVYGIGSYAFEESKASVLSIPEGISYLQEGLFKNAEALQSVFLYVQALPEVSADLLDLAPEGLVLYVKKELYGRFLTDYFWGSFSERIKPMED